MQFAANGRVLCSLTQAADLTWRKLPPEAGTLTLQVGTRDTQALAVSGDADFVAVDVDSAVRLCKLRGTLPISVELLSSPGHYGSVLALAFCLPATKLVTGATDGTVRFWDVCAGVQQNVLQLSESPIRALRFVPGVHVIAAAHDEQISIVRIDGAKKIQTLWGDRQIQSIAVSKDGNSMVTGELAHTVRRTWFPRETVWTAKLWRFGHFSFPLAIGKHDKDVYSVALSTDDDLIAVCGTSAVNVARQDRTIRYSGTIRVFKTRTLSEIWATRNVEGIIRCVRFCPGKRVLATAVDETPVIGENPEQSRRGKVLLWDLDRKRQLQELRVDDGALYCLDFSPDGQLLAAGGAGRKVHIWDVGTHDLVSSSTGHLGAVRSVAFAPDGRLLASGSDDSTVLLWDVSKMQSSGL
jgi:WD40 repeat protein